MKNFFARNWLGGFVGGFLGIIAFGFLGQSLVVTSLGCIIGFLTGYYVTELIPMAIHYYQQGSVWTENVTNNIASKVEEINPKSKLKIFFAKLLASLGLFIAFLLNSIWKGFVNIPRLPKYIARLYAQMKESYANSHPMDFNSLSWLLPVVVMILFTAVLPLHFGDKYFANTISGFALLISVIATIFTLLSLIGKEIEGYSIQTNLSKIVNNAYESRYSNDKFTHKQIDGGIKYLFELFSPNHLFVLMSDYYDPKDKYKQSEMSHYYKRYEHLSKGKVHYFFYILKELVARYILCFILIPCVIFAFGVAMVIFIVSIPLAMIAPIAKLYYSLFRRKAHLPGLLTTIVVTLSMVYYLKDILMSSNQIIATAFLVGMLSGTLAGIIAISLNYLANKNTSFMEFLHRPYFSPSSLDRSGVIEVAFLAPITTVVNYLESIVWESRIKPIFVSLNTM